MTIAPTLFESVRLPAPRPTDPRPVAPRRLECGDHVDIPTEQTLRNGSVGGVVTGLSRDSITVRLHRTGKNRNFHPDLVRRFAKPEELVEDYYAERDPIVVIPCGGKKLDHRAPAGELYTGSQHRLARQAADYLARNLFGRVVILSAKHGLLDLDTVIDPYDVRVGDPDAVEPWDVARQLVAMDARHIIALTPKGYTDLLRARVGARLDDRLAGTTSIFEQRTVLANIKNGKAPIA